MLLSVLVKHIYGPFFLLVNKKIQVVNLQACRSIYITEEKKKIVSVDRLEVVCMFLSETISFCKMSITSVLSAQLLGCLLQRV